MLWRGIVAVEQQQQQQGIEREPTGEPCLPGCACSRNQFTSSFDQSTSKSPSGSFSISHSRPQDPTKPSSYRSATHPSGSGSGARGRPSLPSFNSPIPKTTCTSYPLDRSHHLWMTLFINRTRGARHLASPASVRWSSAMLPLGMGGPSGLADRRHRDLVG